MKPNDARAMVKRQDQQREARGRALTEFLESGGETDRVVPELIPDDVALTVARREVRGLIRRAERTPRGPRRAKVMDELVGALTRLVYVERVMALDALERAALTPAKLVELSRVGQDDLRARLAGLQGESRVAR